MRRAEVAEVRDGESDMTDTRSRERRLARLPGKSDADGEA